jgi:hypothetical protein
MAEIPIQRKKGGAAGLPAWLIPLLALLILIPLLFLLARGCTDAGVVGNANNPNNNRSAAGTTNYNGGNSAARNNTAVVIESNTGGVSVETNSTGNPNSGATITDANYFAGINDKASLVGRQAELSNVRVRRV